MAVVARQTEKSLIHKGGVEKTFWQEQKQKEKKKNFKDKFAFPFFLSCITLRKSTSQNLYYDIYTMRVIVHTE